MSNRYIKKQNYEIFDLIETLFNSIKKQENQISYFIDFVKKIIETQEVLREAFSIAINNIELLLKNINYVYKENKNNKESILFICDYLEENYLKKRN